MNTASKAALGVAALFAAFSGGFAIRPFVDQDRDPVRSSQGGGDAASSDLAYYASRNSHFEEMRTAGPVVFLGDSRIEGAEWSELIGFFISNRGIKGDTTKGVRDRLQSSVPAGTKICLVEVGLNDLSAGVPPDRVAANLAAIAKAAKAKAGRVIVASIIPTAASSADLNASIAEANARASALVKEAGAEWLDLSPVFGSELPAKLSSDGIQLTGAGYRGLVFPILEAVKGP
ncbi:GDSL-type esterase/lipase family protein [Luteolibacter soli]|uniref:GDSL-type esterase/lipase family protein n=1 Tax=Luteolibacter soli TaxID=3135280 RepID=A0ABU9ANR2_9BACT